MYALYESIEKILSFIEKGGVVLVVIAIVTFVMWTLIFERLWFFKTGLKKMVNSTIDTWEARSERKSWNARQIRFAMISRVSEKINANLDLVATIVALCPLLGLLGTVTGMIEVFGVMAATGGGDAKSMASGVSKATIPTMAGMVAALSGVFGATLINNIASRENQLLEDHLTTDH